MVLCGRENNNMMRFYTCKRKRLWKECYQVPLLIYAFPEPEEVARLYVGKFFNFLTDFPSDVGTCRYWLSVAETFISSPHLSPPIIYTHHNNPETSIISRSYVQLGHNLPQHILALSTAAGLSRLSLLATADLSRRSLLEKADLAEESTSCGNPSSKRSTLALSY